MPTESRPPLELLDLLIRANAAVQNPGEEHEGLAEQFTQVMADPATGEQLRALRAQAEAEVMVPRETVESLLAGWDEGLWGPETQDAGVPDTVVGLVDGLRAALAQADAGGES